MQAPSRPAELSESARLLEAAIRVGAEALVDMEQQLNEWDARTGDGDCGTSVRITKGPELGLYSTL